MNFIASSIRNKLMLICGSGTALLLAAALAGMFVQWRSFNQIESEVGQLNERRLSFASAKVAYFDQLLEWKNLLLRITDEHQQTEHWRNFEARSLEVRERVGTAAAEEGDPTSREIADRFLTAHGELAENYRRALDEYRIDYNMFELEKRVRDSDKDASVLLDELVARLSRSVEARTAAIEAKCTQGRAGEPGADGRGLRDRLRRFPVARPQADHLARAYPRTRPHAPRPGRLQRAHRLLDKGRDRTHREQRRGPAQRSRATDTWCRGNDLHGGQGCLANGRRARQRRISRGAPVRGRDLHGKRRRAGDDVDPVDQQQQRTRLHTHPRQPDPISRGRTRLATLAGSVDETDRVMHTVSSTAQAFIANARQIGRITRQVREIAEQTNLLALNAAIEAARAGEQAEASRWSPTR